MKALPDSNAITLKIKNAWFKRHAISVQKTQINTKVMYTTIEDYDAMYTKQGGVCAICQQPETSSRNGKVYRLAVDHDHNTGKVRGLLCFKCNSAMGSFEKRGVPLEKVIQFLERETDCD